MDAVCGQVNVVEDFIMELHGHTRAEENHHFLLFILLQECEKKLKSLVRRTHNVTLSGKTDSWKKR